MKLRDEWVEHCLTLSRRKANFYSGCRKIHRCRTLTFENPFDASLQMADCGFTTHKTRYLERNYIHEESRAAAIDLWNRRRDQAKYGSVGLTCYNHFIKSEKTSKRASVMGPCIQAVTLTWLTKDEYAIDAFYRTTELLKKFPADLVFLRDNLLTPFNFEGMRPVELNCHFANITSHPMYWVTIMPHIDDVIWELEAIKKKDRYFYDWILKWSGRYLCDEFHRGIAKFAQALRVKQDARARIKNLDEIADYIRKNHPGYRNDYTTEEEDEE